MHHSRPYLLLKNIYPEKTVLQTPATDLPFMPRLGKQICFFFLSFCFQCGVLLLHAEKTRKHGKHKTYLMLIRTNQYSALNAGDRNRTHRRNSEKFYRFLRLLFIAKTSFGVMNRAAKCEASYTRSKGLLHL